jgi:hypothetical protein
LGGRSDGRGGLSAGPVDLPKARTRPEPLPDVLRLRDRPNNHRMALLKNNFAPLWDRKLFGNGPCMPTPQGLQLMVPPGSSCTVMALDDPGRRWFEFSVEVQVFRARTPDLVSHAGVFFGWRRGAGPPHDCFLVQVEEPLRGQKGPGRLLVEVGHFSPARGALSEFTGHAPIHPPDASQAPLPQPRPDANGWRRVRVRALDHWVEVSVEGQVLLRFDARKAQAGPGQPGAGLSPRGALGVWACNGAAFFREASVTLLASEEADGP